MLISGARHFWPWKMPSSVTMTTGGCGKTAWQWVFVQNILHVAHISPSFFLCSLRHRQSLPASSAAPSSLCRCIVRQYSSFCCFMNTCWAPHHEMSPKHFTVVTIALFSASEQTQCALVVCHLKSVTHLTQHILNIHRSGDNAVWLLHGQCYVKLLLSLCTFCGHHTTKHQFTASPLKPHV